MIIFKTVVNLQQWLAKQRRLERSIGFVATMGALHKGHLSLIDASNQVHDITVASIFVNPSQFNDPKDFEKYPITIEADCRMLEEVQTDVLFFPNVKEIYPNTLPTPQNYNLGYLEDILEGSFRPGHFQGVCQVVERLLDIIKPDELFLGQKDFQQCMVIKKLVETIPQALLVENISVACNGKVKVTVVATLREPDGLAMSSRNMRLTETDRTIASAIYQQLLSIKENFAKIDIADLKKIAVENLLAAGFIKMDYVEIADANTLLPIDYFANQKAVCLIAAFIGEVRLIDNMLLN